MIVFISTYANPLSTFAAWSMICATNVYLGKPGTVGGELKADIAGVKRKLRENIADGFRFGTHSCGPLKTAEEAKNNSSC